MSRVTTVEVVVSGELPIGFEGLIGQAVYFTRNGDHLCGPDSEQDWKVFRGSLEQMTHSKRESIRVVFVDGVGVELVSRGLRRECLAMWSQKLAAMSA